jgi:hypothetical protein
MGYTMTVRVGDVNDCCGVFCWKHGRVCGVLCVDMDVTASNSYVLFLSTLLSHNIHVEVQPSSDLSGLGRPRKSVPMALRYTIPSFHSIHMML